MKLTYPDKQQPLPPAPRKYYFGQTNPTLIGKPAKVMKESKGRSVVRIEGVLKHVKSDALIDTKPSKYEERKAKLKTGFYPLKKSDAGIQQINSAI
jgi:hypothetical protein